MRSISSVKCNLVLVIGLLAAVLSTPRVFAQTMNLSHYTVTFDQNFATMKTLSVSNVGPITKGGTTWIAHTPYNGDWVNFQPPSGSFRPFGLGNGYLTIRTQAINGVYYGGMLSSVDAKGNGFSQRYGYFEMSAKMPAGAGSWAAFWLMSLPSLFNRTIRMDEIDIAEHYGVPVSTLFSTLHLWDPSHSWAQLWINEALSTQPTMTSGFHTYGVDIQADFITFYFDRKRVGQVPNAIPGYTDKFNQPMYIMLDMAYGQGYSGNNVSNILNHPQDMQVQYVRVWQGSGGSTTSTSNSNSITYSPAKLTLAHGASVSILGASLIFTNGGNLEVTDSHGKILWQSKTSVQCSGNCRAVFQNDGNLVLYGATNSPYWTSHTWNNNLGSLTFSNRTPYLKVMNGSGKTLWSSGG